MASTGRADMVDPVLQPCPVGARYSSGHGRSCIAFDCESQADCDSAAERYELRSDLVCRRVPTCQETQTIQYRSGWRAGQSREWTFSDGPCETDGTCEAGTCTTSSVCVPEAFDPDHPHRPLPAGGCGCAHGSAAASLAVLALVPLAVAWRSTRR